MPKSFLYFFITFLLVYLSVNGWILGWFWHALRGNRILQISLSLIILISAASFPFSFWSKTPGPLQDIALKIGSFWIGIFTYILIITLLLSLSSLIAKLLGFSSNPPHYIQALAALGIPILVGILSLLNASTMILKEIDLTINVKGEHIPKKELTIATLSDMHLGRLVPASRLHRAIEMAAPFKPDIFLFPGDLLDDHTGLDIEAMKKAIQQIQPPLGVWAALGNHEYISGGSAQSIEILQKSGIKILRDQWTSLEDAFILIGRDDLTKNRFEENPRKNLIEITQTIPHELSTLPVILMDHQPYNLKEAEDAGVSLQLSGHTHYGQLWPFNLIVKKIYENPFGYSRRNDTHYIVSAGAGTWGPPMRNSSRPEVLLIRLKFTNQ